MHSSYHHSLFICKILVVSYADLPNVVTFHYTASKAIIFVISPLISSEKPVGFEAVTLMVMDAEFSNI